ncbi:MAG TPA: hypothetical protein VGL86_29405 [Polyangia bacterium]
MKRACATALLAVAVVAVGCARAPSPPPPTTATPITSAPATLAIAGYSDGQDVTLVEGAQGGFHVWMQYAVQDLPPGTVALERSATRASDGAVVLVYRGDVDVGAPDASGWWSAPSPIPMFMCPSPIGISVIDTPVDFVLRLLGDGDVELARAAITLVPHCPDAQADFCTRICSG